MLHVPPIDTPLDNNMNRQAPHQLSQIGLQPDQFKYSDERSWRGPCPICGGHHRFVIFTDNEFPRWHGWCDECGHVLKAWEIVQTHFTEEQKVQYREHAQQMERDRQSIRQAALAKFTASELWTALHAKLSTAHRAQWASWGVPVDWQDYLDLGFTPDKVYRDETGTLKHSAAYTIPYFHYNETTPDNRTFKTLQYRLFDAPDPNDRYRFEYGLQSTFYMTGPTDPIGDEIIICEGAKKGIVTRVSLTGLCVLAVPSKGAWGGIVEAVKKCGRVHILLDPDATMQAVKMARQIGPAARVVRLALKVDDAAISYGLDRDAFKNIIRQAWRV